MPRASGIKQLLSPSQGLVTEQSQLTPVEGSTISEVNFDFNDDGSIRQRRLGVAPESGSSLFALDCTIDATKACAYAFWKSVGGVGGTDFHVFQIGNCLIFVEDSTGTIYGNLKGFSYELGLQASSGYSETGTHSAANDQATLTDGTKTWTVDEWVGYTIYNTTDGSSGVITANTATTVTATLAGGTDNDWDTSDAYIISFVEDEPVDMISGDGYLFVVGKKLEPFYIEYDPVGDTITANNVNIRIRDLTGLDDSLDVSERPASLTDEHTYNLRNQGWEQSRRSTHAGAFSDPITLFYTSTGSTEYPSNADIAYLGMVDDGSGNLVFDGDNIRDLTLGNTPAPKGHYLHNPFCIDYDNPLDGGYGTTVSFTGGSGAGGGVVTPPPWYQSPLYESEK